MTKNEIKKRIKKRFPSYRVILIGEEVCLLFYICSLKKYPLKNRGYYFTHCRVEHSITEAGLDAIMARARKDLVELLIYLRKTYSE